MQNDNNTEFEWNPALMLEISLSDPDSFLKIKETLTRIGISSKREPILYQTCHILHKKGKYYIVSFLELFALDGKQSSICDDDIARRNTIAVLLQQWGLCKILPNDSFTDYLKAPIASIKIIPHHEKKNWQLVQKYSLGKYKSTN